MRAIFIIFDFLVMAGIVFLVTVALFLAINKLKVLYYKLMTKENELERIAMEDQDKYYCCDCEKVFYSKQSVKTDVGIYPCPYCSSNHTCLDTLQVNVK